MADLIYSPQELENQVNDWLRHPITQMIFDRVEEMQTECNKSVNAYVMRHEWSKASEQVGMFEGFREFLELPESIVAEAKGDSEKDG